MFLAPPHDEEQSQVQPKLLNSFAAECRKHIACAESCDEFATQIMSDTIAVVIRRYCASYEGHAVNLVSTSLGVGAYYARAEKYQPKYRAVVAGPTEIGRSVKVSVRALHQRSHRTRPI